ncbi:MAG: hypothetical protein H0T79_23815 [Deltaproteobacteria bacterium]|nr:hypothetical protein [Deltaproteobacteria bacterium]
MRRLVLVAAILSSTLGTAHAGRSFFGWLYPTEVLPERGVELQTWVFERDRLGPANTKETSMWVGPQIGVTDQLELSFPVEWRWLDTGVDGTRPTFTWERYGAEARYRFVTMDPVDRPAFAPLARVAVKREVTLRDATRVEADLVGSYEVGRALVLVDIGFLGTLRPSNSQFSLVPGAGISVNVAGDLRFGLEGFGEIALDSGHPSWYAVGPNASWTHGRFWLTGAFGIGVHNIRTAPRVMWGILF